MSVLSLADVCLARRRLEGRVARSPLVESPALSIVAGTTVYLKLETVQPTGSFKIRGATNAIAALAQRGVERVVTASTGNHGCAVAYAARAAGVDAIVCLSSLVPANKVEAVRALGAQVRIVGKSQDDAEREAQRLASSGALAYVPPFDDLHVIAGQATIGLEIVEALPDVSQIVVPLSGGGLFSGVAFAAKQCAPDTRLIGVTMRRGAAMHASLGAGKPVLVDELETLADSLGGGIGLANRFTFALTQALIDEALLVEEEAIAEALVHAYRHERLVVEGAAAVGIAAVSTGAVSASASASASAASARDTRCGPLVIVVTGANIDMELHRRIVRQAADAHSEPIR
ncbi:hydroxyectoine utilization dehydratase EutB [Trinickia caryophylli]|uniref:Threonine dehydratase n=1 Tax=Trinickia caryophylli TaxID=28094 RepID=A0A1X7CYY3_TRICW|nr:hydroxyectoine utilization dehydratase EutB [Trinickia caryophylli]PMS13504.1 hydroxyectoine utilization dehydratase EutB [Trinickia caryophylli]TRX13638.1 hydroxyectoine utilization dehydratase EutB [Trinickia caryophylli]WQE15219.1 hydroxyectoine utilization dehydratase EutB [Trinickia caryophylli]SMF05597.1 threonine dehydratase [Trinickia caryophylli]GLU31040.1 hydroxyectoine utilization dehydratase EutB [Trinickia caryophylli]